VASTVLSETRNAVRTLTLNRPDKFNALSHQLVLDLTSALRAADEDAAARVVLIRAAGKAWCAGGDLDELLELAKGDAGPRRAYLRDFKAMIDTVRAVAKPVIAVVQGVCVGGGNELNVACDLALASEKARFGQAGPRVGSVPAFGIPQDFHLTVGEKKAKEVVMLCRLYPAAEAKAMGWINEVVAPEQLDHTAGEWAAELIEKSPTALALAKRMHNLWHNLASQVAEDGIEQLARFWGTPEALEGFTAFREKRKPDFGRFAR
jgi:enoyl-CoA hydratase/carnithine racemase